MNKRRAVRADKDRRKAAHRRAKGAWKWSVENLNYGKPCGFTTAQVYHNGLDSGNDAATPWKTIRIIESMENPLGLPHFQQRR